MGQGRYHLFHYVIAQGYGIKATEVRKTLPDEMVDDFIIIPSFYVTDMKWLRALCHPKI